MTHSPSTDTAPQHSSPAEVPPAITTPAQGTPAKATRPMAPVGEMAEPYSKMMDTAPNRAG